MLIWVVIFTLQSNISANLTGVLQTYQQDLKEFGIGLKKETAAITGVTAHVVKDLPTSIETGATVAQESLETVGQTLEDFGSSVWRGYLSFLCRTSHFRKRDIVAFKI